MKIDFETALTTKGLKFKEISSDLVKFLSKRKLLNEDRLKPTFQIKGWALKFWKSWRNPRWWGALDTFSADLKT